MNKIQTLTCATGHTWTRPAQRGKPPRFCDRYPACSNAASAKPPEQQLKEHQTDLLAWIEKRRGQKEERQTTIDEQIAEVTNPFLQKAQKENPFLKFKKVTPDEAEEAEIAESFFEPDKFKEKLNEESQAIPQEEVSGEGDEDAEASPRKADKAEQAAERKLIQKFGKQAEVRNIKVADILDDERHHCASMPGLFITGIMRDEDGRWSGTIEMNSENFEVYLKGGWAIKATPFDRHVVPQIAAELTARMRQLERQYDPSAREVAEIQKTKKKAQEFAESIGEVPEGAGISN